MELELAQHHEALWRNKEQGLSTSRISQSLTISFLILLSKNSHEKKAAKELEMVNERGPDLTTASACTGCISFPGPKLAFDLYDFRAAVGFVESGAEVAYEALAVRIFD